MAINYQDAANVVKKAEVSRMQILSEQVMDEIPSEVIAEMRQAIKDCVESFVDEYYKVEDSFVEDYAEEEKRTDILKEDKEYEGIGAGNLGEFMFYMMIEELNDEMGTNLVIL